jgi:hypothetical protein
MAQLNLYRLLCLATPLLLGTGLCDSTRAHELGASSSGQTWSPERLAYMPMDRAVAQAPTSSSTPHPFYVIVLPNKWANTQTIHVCFYGGNDALRTRILDVAKMWFVHTNLKLGSGLNGPNCIANDKSEVRIGFNEPGLWSYIGNDSISDYLVSHSMSSMNFSNFDKTPPQEPEFTGYVLHEWGHALGLHHEHQSPAGGCDAEYDWPKVYAYYKTQYGWDQQMVDDNLKQLVADRSAYDWSIEDPLSIMIYASDPSFLKYGVNDKCYFHDNQTLSKLDAQGIQLAYPPVNASDALMVQVSSLPGLLGMDLTPAFKTAVQRQLDLAKKTLEGKSQ